MRPELGIVANAIIRVLVLLTSPKSLLERDSQYVGLSYAELKLLRQPL
jgi:hypothetical protein